MQFPGRNLSQLVSDVSPHGSRMCRGQLEGKHLPALKRLHHNNGLFLKYLLVFFTVVNIICTPVHAVSLHTVFTTECTPYFTWQSIGELSQLELRYSVQFHGV